ncbi:MAG: hypothetical protein JXA49_04580 [Actinobacteria bacterium]|nr:hypothetical protein [Actinomycetota bacterium]
MFRITHLKGQGGFTFIEVVVATLLFAVSVVGVAGMMAAGGANVSRGANESTAANLAAERLEEVKSLQYYVPYEYMKGDRDIDDFYFNMSQPNGVAGNPDAHPQLDNPYVVEDYGTIPGFSKFKRTTAVEYQYLNGDSFVPAVMKTGWMPKYPPSIGVDEPRGGLDEADNEEIHAMIVEVTVTYETREGPRVYKQRGLVGDLLVPGGQNDPVLSVNSIDPISGYTNDSNFQMKIYVDAVGDLNPSSSLEVRLWYPGRTDIVAYNAQANEDGTMITCYFDFTQPEIIPIKYHLSVYWIEEGFQDKNFRECFTLIPPPPGITDVKEYDWGYRAQGARRVRILGASLASPSGVRLRGPVEGSSDVVLTGSVISASNTEVIAEFNMTSVPDDQDYFNKHWDVEVDTMGGTITSDDNSERVLLNPPPAAGSISQTSASASREYSGVVVTGTYFQNYPSAPEMKLVKDVSTLPVADDVIYVSIDPGSGSFNETFTGTSYDSVSMNLLRSNFHYWGDETIEIPEETNLDGRYYLYVRNADGTAVISSSVYVDIADAPPTEPIISSVVVEEGNPSEHVDYHCYNDWDVPVTIYGENFNTDPLMLQYQLSDTYGLTGTPVVTGPFGPGQRIEGLVINTIGLITKGYELEITNVDTGEQGTFMFNITEPAADAVVVMAPGATAPSGGSWPQANPFWNDSGISNSTTDTSSATNICREADTYTYRIIAKRMRNSNVVWWFDPEDKDPYTMSASIDKSRSGKWVRAYGSAPIPNWSWWIFDYKDVNVKCSNNGGATYGPEYNNRVRIRTW